GRRAGIAREIVGKERPVMCGGGREVEARRCETTAPEFLRRIRPVFTLPQPPGEIAPEVVVAAMLVFRRQYRPPDLGEIAGEADIAEPHGEERLFQPVRGGQHVVRQARGGSEEEV